MHWQLSSARQPLNHLQPTPHGVQARIPNGDNIQASHTAMLDWPNVPTEAKDAHIFPAMSNNLGLVSVGKLCDQDCEALFKKDKVIVSRHDEILLTGHRDKKRNLWMVPLMPFTATTPEDIESMATTIHLPFQYIGSMATETSTLPDLIRFLHAVCFSPAPSTWIQAIEQNFFTTWPALTAANVRKHLPKSLATAQGHLDQSRKNANSTRN